jgi:hypothetical protein
LDIPSPDSAPAALADLIAAGLVSHEMIGDPGRLGETEALRTLCGLVAGPIWRIEPFHYAFRVAPGDLGGACDGTGAEARAAALEAALQGALGADAVWVNATDLVPAAAGAAAPAAAALPEAPLLLLRAQAEAVAEALAPAGPEVQAVIGARYAVAAARLAAGVAGEGEALADRLAAIEACQATILAALAAATARAERDRAEHDAALDRLAGGIAALADRIDAAAAHAEAVADAVAEGAAAEAAGHAAFRETLGLALAEFLAELERRSAAPMPVRVPQFS